MTINGYDIIKINIHNYFNGNVGLEFICLDKEFGIPEPFAIITKNLEDNLVYDEAYIDVNNCPWAIDILNTYKIAKPTGETFRSGFVEYPKYKINFRRIDELNKGELACE